METLKSPTMNLFALLDEEERKKQLERTTRETTTQPPRTTTRTEIRQPTTGPKPTNAKDSYPTTSTRPEQVKGGNVIEEVSSPIPTRKLDRKSHNRPRQRQINVTRTGKQRVFDRHSGTGRPPIEMKKGGAGEFNWGGIEDVIEEGLIEEYEGAPSQFEQPELQEETTTAPTQPSTTTEKTDYLSLDEYSAKIAEQQRKIEQKYGQVSVRSVDDSWAKGLVGLRKRSIDEGEKQNESQQLQHETSKKNQTGNRKVVNASELFKIVVPGHEGREGRKRREYHGQDKSRQRKGEKVVDTNDKESFPSLTGK